MVNIAKYQLLERKLSAKEIISQTIYFILWMYSKFVFLKR